MKSNTHKIKTIAVLWFQLYLYVKLESNIISVFNWIKAYSSLCRALNRRREREREREVCVRTEQADTERERQRGVCALGEQDLALRAAVPVILRN